ncbi:MAG: DUF2484 family protein [Pseudomonadota bacterium]
MTLVVSCCLWVLTATAVALMPMRRQFLPDLILLLAAPALLIWVLLAAGRVWALGAALAFVSLYRKPSRYRARQVRERLSEAMS